jgi:hypothetical protein
MNRSLARLLGVFALPIAAVHAMVACSSHATQMQTSTTASSSSGAGGAGTSGTGGMVGTGGASSSSGTGGTDAAAPDPTAICKTLMLTSRPWSSGAYGTLRGDYAGDFSVPLSDMTTWNFKANFSGCESYVFVPDTIPVSSADSTSIWASEADLLTLLKTAPKNVHYFFVSRQTADGAATTAISGMQKNINTALSKLSAADKAHWTDHVHLVSQKASALGNWISVAFSSIGQIGFSIDRLQRIRGAGDLSDVTRQDATITTGWPFKQNLAYVAHDPAYFNAEADLQARLDAENATVLNLWQGEVLMQQATTMATLPDATTMASFDTLEVEITQQCPNPNLIEIGNCGAWDYIANFSIADDPMNTVEIARFITSYHRETHWVEDISEMLPLLKSGGMHSFLWSFAPSWNTQPTATTLSLRFSNQKKGMTPTASTFLFSGGNFTSMYNVGRMPVQVPIPATAKKVELWVLVTGHGQDMANNECCEFCDHQHQFTVNTTMFTKDFPLAGTETGCIAEDTNGMTPNQAGTWWYGRGGWCPGKQVDPWVSDVTAAVTPGQMATVTYEGLYGGLTPPDTMGNIVLASYLVVWE